MKTIILIPAYKPEESFADFSQRLVERGHRVVAVNDGSGPEFDDVFERVAAMGVTVLRHDVNKGKGRALKTGFEYITEHEPDKGLVVTADCDGQHTIPDIERIIATEEEHPDAFVIGGRFRDKSVKVPLRSRLGNGITRILFRVATGIKIHDTQTGLRGIPASLFGEMLKIKGERYEYEMNMLLYLRDWRNEYIEVPIETVYINENAGSHYSPFKDSLRILAQIIKFTASSMFCFLIDYILFIVFSTWVFAKGDTNLATLTGVSGTGIFVTLLSSLSLSYICARVISATLNYTLNRRLVFKKGTKSSALKYLILTIAIMLVGALLTGLFIKWSGWPGFVCKIIVDFFLFFVNFFFQREWVFRKKKS